MRDWNNQRTRDLGQRGYIYSFPITIAPHVHPLHMCILEDFQ